MRGQKELFLACQRLAEVSSDVERYEVLLALRKDAFQVALQAKVRAETAVLELARGLGCGQHGGIARQRGRGAAK